MDEKVFEEAARDFLNGSVNRGRCAIDPLYAAGAMWRNREYAQNPFENDGKIFAKDEYDARWRIYLIDYAEKAFAGAWLECVPSFLHGTSPALHVSDVAKHLCKEDGCSWDECWESYMDKAYYVMDTLFKNGRTNIQGKIHISKGSFKNALIKQVE